MAHHVAVFRLEEQRAFPKGLGQRRKPERGEEALAILDHLLPIRIALLEQGGEVVSGIRIGRGEQRIDVAPVLRPHIPQQVGRNGAAGRHRVAIFFAQTVANVGVQREV